MPEHSLAIRALQDVSTLLYEHGWGLGTSGNYSVVLSRQPLRLLITASGKDKRRLSEDEFVVVDAGGRAIDANGPKPSAETLLHCTLAEQAGIGAILHTHSVWNTLVSSWTFADRYARLAGYEMLKGLEGIRTHACEVAIPILENSQDIPAMAARLRESMADELESFRYAFLIHRHGLYTWGRDLDEARRHVEILEFLFEVVGRQFSPSRA